MTARPQRLRVLNWNAHGLRDDVDALTRVVADARAHVVCLQEAPRHFRWRARSAALARRCGMVVLAGGGEDAVGNLLLCSLAVTVRATRSLRLPLTPGEQPRAAALARCTLGGVPFTAVGVHLGLHPAERVRHVPVLLAEATAGGDPVVLAGDLNERPGGPVWQDLGRSLRDAAGTDETPTFSCGAPDRRIDAIFADPALAVRHYAVLDSPSVRRASDHFPVYAELELPTG
ncbi:MAG TPA: endonuclease/exonuclease/phosphatase family protein [Cryptosporangiaceae bacterium]|nr:endonuclease/exonuclease/phosphatase family protein [Cryptosporangiaceae bacterium]